MSTTNYDFEADLDPETRCPRVRFNFDNGWTASLIMRMGISRTGCMQASVAAWPTGKIDKGVIEYGPHEATADEAMSWIFCIRQRADVRREAA